MPLKAAVLPLLDAAAPVVEAVGAANTVVLRDGRRVGDNTDVPGIAAALADVGVVPDGEVAVLGAGATARSAVAALGGSAVRVTVYARTPARAVELAGTAEAVGVPVDVRPWAEASAAFSARLVVNTAPAPAAAGWLPRLPARVGALLDVLYDPWPTPLAAAWRARGGVVVGGLDLLVRQAVLQVALFTGRTVDEAGLVSRLRAAGQRALRER
jgi:shikimate dehydrogenase